MFEEVLVADRGKIILRVVRLPGPRVGGHPGYLEELVERGLKG